MLLYHGHLQRFPTDRQNIYGIASVLAFGALQFTIDYFCRRNGRPAKGSPLFQYGAQESVNFLVPPALDLGLTLQKVSFKGKVTMDNFFESLMNYLRFDVIYMLLLLLSLNFLV